MKKLLIIFVTSVMLLGLTGCAEKITYHENGVPTYFLEPEGHVIVKINATSDNIFTDRYLYGYITNEEYQAYLDGTLSGMLVIKHPYEEGKCVVTSIKEIESMQVGVYEDKRHKQ